jgi:hypothetical protein
MSKFWLVVAATAVALMAVPYSLAAGGRVVLLEQATNVGCG